MRTFTRSGDRPLDPARLANMRYYVSGECNALAAAAGPGEPCLRLHARSIFTNAAWEEDRRVRGCQYPGSGAGHDNELRIAKKIGELEAVYVDTGTDLPLRHGQGRNANPAQARVRAS